MPEDYRCFDAVVSMRDHIVPMSFERHFIRDTVDQVGSSITL